MIYTREMNELEESYGRRCAELRGILQEDINELMAKQTAGEISDTECRDGMYDSNTQHRKRSDEIELSYYVNLAKLQKQQLDTEIDALTGTDELSNYTHSCLEEKLEMMTVWHRKMLETVFLKHEGQYTTDQCGEIMLQLAGQYHAKAAACDSLIKAKQEEQRSESSKDEKPMRITMTSSELTALFEQQTNAINLTLQGDSDALYAKWVADEINEKEYNDGEDRLAAHYKEKGDEVEINYYGSIFELDRQIRLDYQASMTMGDTPYAQEEYHLRLAAEKRATASLGAAHAKMLEAIRTRQRGEYQQSHCEILVQTHLNGHKEEAQKIGRQLELEKQALRKKHQALVKDYTSHVISNERSTQSMAEDSTANPKASFWTSLKQLFSRNT